MKYLMHVAFLSVVISLSSVANEITMPQTALPPPSDTSSQFKHAITQFPVPTVEESIAATPQTVEQWRDYIQQRNADQKKKIKKMRKQFNVHVELLDIAGVTVRKITPESLSQEFKDKVYIDVHGGAYVLFGGLPSIEEGILIAHRLGIVVLSVDYRMPPSSPAPAALHDVLAVYKDVLTSYSADNIFVGGTSAGGGLILAVTQQLIKDDIAPPRALYAGTPWADLTKTGDTLFTNEGVDRILVTYDGQLASAAKLYASGKPLDDASISPLYGSFEGFPPTFLLTGTRDMFLSDTVRVNRKIRDSGGDTVLEVFEGMSHADYLIAYETPESIAAYRAIKQFFSQHTASNK